MVAETIYQNPADLGAKACSPQQPRKKGTCFAWSVDVDELPRTSVPPGWDRTILYEDIEEIFAFECWGAFVEVGEKFLGRKTIPNFWKEWNGSVPCPDLFVGDLVAADWLEVVATNVRRALFGTSNFKFAQAKLTDPPDERGRD
jgi:hypothetical protein